MPDPIRKQRVVRFTRMVQDTIVDGLQRVFTSEYAERQLREMNIVTDFPLTRQSYPAVIIDFEDQENRAAGIGHQEVFFDPNGILRVWDHRRFTGTITFQCWGESPEDRDIIYDSVVEAISFGHLPSMSLQQNLFARLYGTPDDPDDRFRALAQLFLNTDKMRNGGKSVTPAPWGAEDDLLFRKDLVIDCIGGFYNSIPGLTVPGHEMVSDVFVYPHMHEVLSLALIQQDTYKTDAGETFDANVVSGVAEVIGGETWLDARIVSGVAVVSGVDSKTP